jgi:hypothetical protein
MKCPDGVPSPSNMNGDNSDAIGSHDVCLLMKLDGSFPSQDGGPDPEVEKPGGGRSATR